MNYLEIIPTDQTVLQILRVPVTDMTDAIAKMPALLKGDYADAQPQYHECGHEGDPTQPCRTTLIDPTATNDVTPPSEP